METQNNSIKIYKMIIQAMKQNKKSLKYNVEELKDILDIKNSTRIWCHFNEKVLEKAKEDINIYSNIVLDIKKYKTKQKFTDIEFIFEYKNKDLKNQEEEIYLTSIEKKEKEVKKNKYKSKRNKENKITGEMLGIKEAITFEKLTKFEINFFMHIMHTINNEENKIFEEQKIHEAKLKNMIKHNNENTIQLQIAIEKLKNISKEIFLYLKFNDRYYKKYKLMEFVKIIPFFEYIRTEITETMEISLTYKLTESVVRYMLALKAKYKQITIEDIKRAAYL